MNNWQKLRETFKRLNSNPQFRSFWATPVAKIIGINTVLFILWRIKGVSETFLVRHFSFDRYNIREHRYHTMVTHAFSHFGFFSYLINMLVFGTFARGIQMMYGNRLVWWLYLLGAATGGLTMYFGMPYTPVIIPQVGADAPLAAIITFYGMLNLRNTVFLFFFPVPTWALLGFMGVYSLIEPSKKNLGGMMAGLLVYQLFRIRMI